jgi:hypothetical protein
MGKTRSGVAGGAHTASKAASISLHRILERGDKPFDAQWMHETFDIF